LRIEASSSADSHRRWIGPAIAAMLHQFAGDHLALAVGIGGNHQFPGFPQ
jgi:hypothetical protein